MSSCGFYPSNSIEPAKNPASKIDFADYSLEDTAKAISELDDCKSTLPPGIPVNIAFLGNETDAQRISAARHIRRLGLEPVPMVSARRLTSLRHLDELLLALARAAFPTRVIVVGGDPLTPAGALGDARAILESQRLEKFEQVGIVGYPQGHHRIADSALWSALLAKAALLDRNGRTFEITTQYCLEANAVIAWVAKLRTLGVTCRVRIGVPGPAPAGRLRRFAEQFGVLVPDWIAGMPPTATASFEDFLSDLRRGLNEVDHGSIGLHLYPFGGTARAIEWLGEQQAVRAPSEGMCASF